MIVPRNSAFAEERAEVELLLAQAEKQKDFNKRLEASVLRVDDIAKRLDEALGPVYNDTQSLSVVTNNAERLLSELRRQIKPVEGKEVEERTIRNGPATVGVLTYLVSLRSLEQKLSNLRSTNFRVNQEAIAELVQLLKYGNQQLQDLFESMIQEDRKVIEPLHYITKQLPFPVIPQSKTSELASLNGFISSNQPRNGGYGQDISPSVRTYADVRALYLSSSLQNLASASISTSRKKSVDTIYRQGTSGIGTYASGMEGVFLAEWLNITNIFPRDAWATVFEMTTRKGLSEFARTVRDLSIQIKSSITTDCFLAYEIVGIVNNLAITIDSQTGSLKQQLVDACKPCRDIAKASVGELYDDIKRRIGSMISLPADGAAIPFTTEVMTRLQTLTLYPQPLSSILSSLGDGNWSSTPGNNSSSSLTTTQSFDTGADGNQLLARYISESIETLLSSLDSKARVLLKSKAVSGVFLANNVAVVDRMIRSSKIQALLIAINSLTKLEPWRKKGIATYLDAWREPCAALMDVQYTNRGARPPSGSNTHIDSGTIVKGLGSKDKDALKEKFKTFNISFEGLSAKHRDIANSMEREVRAQLARDIQAMIEPLYARFWDRYHEVDKGRGKYVRYDKGALAAQLASMG